MAASSTAEADMSRALPAPATFAPSRKDVLSSLAFFFGDPAVPEKLRDYSEHHAQTCTHHTLSNRRLSSHRPRCRLETVPRKRCSRVVFPLLVFVSADHFPGKEDYKHDRKKHIRLNSTRLSPLHRTRRHSLTLRAWNSVLACAVLPCLSNTEMRTTDRTTAFATR